jgi:hypothetical protein
MDLDNKAGMADEKVLGDTLKYCPTRFQTSCNRRRSHLFKYAGLFLDDDFKFIYKGICRVQKF